MTPRRRVTRCRPLALAILVGSACQAGGRPSAATSAGPPPQAAASPAPAPCDSARAQLEITACWTSAATQAEALESAQFAKAVEAVKHKGTAEQAAAIAVAEEKWKAYREAQCRADAGFYAGGSAAAAAAAVCRTRIAEDRTSALERTYLDWTAR